MKTSYHVPLANKTRKNRLVLPQNKGIGGAARPGSALALTRWEQEPGVRECVRDNRFRSAERPGLRYFRPPPALPSARLSFAAEFLFNEGNNVSHRAEVVGHHFFIIYRDGETILNEADEFDHSRGVDHVAQQWQVAGQRFLTAKKKVLCDKCTNFLFDVRCLQ